jgi:Ca2+-binding EF-hand superfamily protein
MKHLWIVTLLVSSVLAVGQGRDMPSFSFFDADGDGKITEQELNDGRAKRQAQKKSEGKMLRNAQSAPSFSEIDTNGDGYISKEEFQAHQKARRAQ